MIVRRSWWVVNETGEVYQEFPRLFNERVPQRREGWFLFGVLPLYIRPMIEKPVEHPEYKSIK
jgi:hypothetical protein